MIESIKDLEKLLKLCRRQGVTEINLGAVSLKLGDMPQHTAAQASEDTIEDVLEDFPDGPLSPEELTFFANGGLPQDNPYRS